MTQEAVNDEVIDKVVTNEVVEEVKAEPSEVEQKAAKMGWTPKDEFKGDPAKWRPAEEFVERGENMLPLVKAQIKRQDKEILELKETLRQFGEYNTKAEQRAYEKAMHDLKQQRADAIAAGDGVAFDKVDTAIEQLKSEVTSVKKPQEDTRNDPVYVEWLSTNAWVKDPVMERWATNYGEFLIKNGDADYGADVFEKITKAAKEKYPEKFENARRTNVPSVEGGQPAQRKGGKAYADIPSADRSACERMAKNAFPDDTKAQATFKANYTKTYFEEA
jgi:hypothetical protein